LLVASFLDLAHARVARTFGHRRLAVPVDLPLGLDVVRIDDRIVVLCMWPAAALDRFVA